MTKLVTVSSHTRKVEKSPEYINTHLALFSRRADRIAFARKHGVVIANDEETKEPVRRSLAEIAADLMALAKSMGRS